MRSYASAYKMCVATLPKPSQPDGSIAPCRPTRSPATGSVGMAEVIASAREGGGEQLPSRFTSHLIFDDLIFNPLKIPEAKHFYVTLEQTTIWYRTGNFFKLQKSLW